MSTSVDKANIEFWDELCGSHLAKTIGIRDHSLASIKRFDEAYMDFYPYLQRHLNLQRLSGKRVLEIGLGYGTVGQKIAESGAEYIGLDLAAGPVKMMRHRLRLQNLAGATLRGNILNAPLESETLDYIVSIGCFHHTGDVRRCVDETYRMLKPGGTAIIMVYNKYSFRQWRFWPRQTLLTFARDSRFHRDGRGAAAEDEKAAYTALHRSLYDQHSSGMSAPETDFLSVKQLRQMFASFSTFAYHKENCDDFQLGGRLLLQRKYLLSSLGKALGLDIYIEAQK
jgi:SAM-dependent methyltransferase